MAAKSGGKTTFVKSHQQTLQSGRQKWRENDFCKKSPVDCRHPVGQKFRRNGSISLRYQDKHIFAFNAEIKDSRQKWQENDFCEKWPVNFADTLWVKNFVKIALSRSVSEINTFLRLTQKIKMATKNGGKTNLVKSYQ